MKTKFLLLFVLLVNLAYSNEFDEEENMEFKLTLFDVPYNLDNDDKFFLTSPSMDEALDLTTSLYLFEINLTDSLIDKTFSPSNETQEIIIRSLGHFIVYLGVMELPFHDIWLHEEYHRAVMNKNGIDSYNEVYEFDLGSDSISVSQVKDSDLINLKKDSPKDLIRLHAAGYEGQNALVLNMEKQTFFKNREFGIGEQIYSLMNITNNYFYLSYTTDMEADADVDEMNSQENTISERDFTGYDFTAWVYDLFRPDEAYESRGTHISGVGIDRYVKFSDLTNDEQDYLKKQSKLAALSFIDMQLLGIKPISLGSGRKMTLNIKHQLTSFGNSIDTNILYKNGDTNMLFILSNYSNYNNSFVGLNFELIDFPTYIFDRDVLMSYRVSLWEQPKNQEFMTDEGEIGGLLGVQGKVMYSDSFSYNLGFEAKSDGWVASNVYLENNVSAKFGVSFYY